MPRRRCCDNGCWDNVKDNIKTSLSCLGVLAVLALIVAAVVLVPAYGYLRHVKITVDDASLTRFELVKSPMVLLAYNLSLTLRLHNPNWAIGVTNDEPLMAAYTFDGQPLDRVRVAGKGDRLGARRTEVFHVGSSSPGAGAMLGSAGEARFREQNATGVFEVGVRLTGKFRYTTRYTRCELGATCPLKLRITPPQGKTTTGGGGAVTFERVTCTLDKPKKYC